MHQEEERGRAETGSRKNEEDLGRRVEMEQ